MHYTKEGCLAHSQFYTASQQWKKIQCHSTHTLSCTEQGLVDGRLRPCYRDHSLGRLWLAGGGGGSGGGIEGGDIRLTPPTPVPLCVEVYECVTQYRKATLHRQVYCLIL